MTNTTTPSREEMIQAIYEKIADKTLSFGCNFLCKYGTDINYIRRIIIGDLGREFLTVYPDYPFPLTKNHPLFHRVKKNCVLKIIGHPVMIGDVMEYSNFEIYPINHHQACYGTFDDDIAQVINLWREKRKPIEEQSDECVEFVYHLISE